MNDSWRKSAIKLRFNKSWFELEITYPQILFILTFEYLISQETVDFMSSVKIKISLHYL